MSSLLVGCSWKRCQQCWLISRGMHRRRVSRTPCAAWPPTTPPGCSWPSRWARASTYSATRSACREVACTIPGCACATDSTAMLCMRQDCRTARCLRVAWMVSLWAACGAKPGAWVDGCREGCGHHSGGAAGGCAAGCRAAELAAGRHRAYWGAAHAPCQPVCCLCCMTNTRSGNTSACWPDTCTATVGRRASARRHASSASLGCSRCGPRWRCLLDCRIASGSRMAPVVVAITHSRESTCLTSP